MSFIRIKGLIQAEFAGDGLPDVTTTVPERLLRAHARLIVFFTYIILAAPTTWTRPSADSKLRAYIIAIVLFNQLLFKLIVVKDVKL
jgi:hypothetical protein